LYGSEWSDRPATHLGRGRVDQTIQSHTNGTMSVGTVNGASQTGSTITLNAITGTLKKGDIITFDAGLSTAVNGVNRLTKQSLGSVAQFVVTGNVSTSGTSVGIYPALTPISGTPNTVQYATVTRSPRDGAVVGFATSASATIRENLVFRKEAFTIVFADLPLIRNGVVKSARESYDGVSLRMVEGYQILTDVFVDRLDALYGYTMPRPEWCVIVADQL